ncbi:MAG TPA: lipid-A-disaccharide synthase [Caulobacteraceae bacterium]|nr:lipid-A-disaccharide synthase [Caulobacteraceae bacterium]
MNRPIRIMLVAGEASGDALGAQLARALKRRLAGRAVRFVGVGGAQMAGEGVQSPFDYRQVTVLGFFEGLLAYPRILARVRDTVAVARREQPDIAVLIDSWGFTLRVAQGLKRAMPALPVVKYVGPQVWASRPGRARTLAQTVDRLLSIHVFDAPFFEREGLATRFVGNPTLHRDFSGADPARLRARLGGDPEAPILLVLPGSRPSEIEKVGPHFLDAASRLKAERPELRIVLPVAPTVAALVRDQVAKAGVEPLLIEDDQLKYDAMKAATVALACSGTVTTELALAGCPMVVGYRVGWITYPLIKVMIRTRYITLFNIAAQAFVAPEFVQTACNGPSLARALAERLDDPDLRAHQIAAQNDALDKMGRGGPDPSERAADAVIEVLERAG